jgi:hydantoinase/carbamoylase family amidase
VTPLAPTVVKSLDELSRIGASPDGGVTRLAWSPELFAAYDWVGDRMRAVGLAVEVDPAGNLIGRWDVGKGAPVVVGSHLDTVPSGGRLDGALGVVGAVHAVAELRRRGHRPARPLLVVAFMDEEGTRFGAALFGSRAFAGEDVTPLGSRADAAGTTLAAAMHERGYDIARAGEAARIDDVHAYLELHIEQGPVLELGGTQIGVVTSIVGARRYTVRLQGQANHAGTTPMTVRRDAFSGAARIALELRDYARSHRNETVTVGTMSVGPGGVNVIPGLAEFTVDARGPTGESVARLERQVAEVTARIAREENLEARLEETSSLEPVELDPGLVDAVERAAAAEGASSLRLPSGAGHDAMVIGRHVPAAMIFVPSTGGISHAPAEDTPANQLELGVRVLAATLEEVLG